MTVDEYEQLAASGTLRDRRVQLVNGYLVRKSTTDPRHVIATEGVRRRLERILPEGWHIRQEQPIRISTHDEPEPDVVVARGNPRYFKDRHPEPSHIALPVEVADSSLTSDRGDQLAIYARAAIPLHWIVNLVGGSPPGAGVVEVYSDPDQAVGRYRSRSDYRPGDDAPVVIDGQQVGRVAVSEMLP